MPEYHVGGEEDYEEDGQPETLEQAAQFAPAFGPDHSRIHRYGYDIHTVGGRNPMFCSGNLRLPGGR